MLNHNRESSSWNRKSLDEIIDLIDEEGYRVAFKRIMQWVIANINDVASQAANFRSVENLRNRVSDIENEVRNLKNRIK